MRYIISGRLLLLGFAVACCIPASFGQSVDQYVFASAGGTAAVSGGTTLTFTTGEPIITTAGSNPVLSQGFNQPSLTVIPLSVQMVFDGKTAENANLLFWDTYNESHNSHFDLERSNDGIKFAAITTITTKAPGGNSSVKLSYAYTDKAYADGVNYYRLKQVDDNGRFVYSSIVKLNNKRATAAFSVAPNPAKNSIDVVVSEPGMFTITDMNGKVVLKRTIQSAAHLDLSNIIAGAYFVNFQGTTIFNSIKFIKE